MSNLQCATDHTSACSCLPCSCGLVLLCRLDGNCSPLRPRFSRFSVPVPLVYPRACHLWSCTLSSLFLSLFLTFFISLFPVASTPTTAEAPAVLSFVPPPPSPGPCDLEVSWMTDLLCCFHFASRRSPVTLFLLCLCVLKTLFASPLPPPRPALSFLSSFFFQHHPRFLRYFPRLDIDFHRICEFAFYLRAHRNEHNQTT